MIWQREEYIELMTFGKIERQMFSELFGLLVGLEEEWLTQGASREEVELVAFDWDYVSTVECGGNTGIISAKKPFILEDTQEYTIRINEFGKREKLIKKSASIFHPLEYPVRNMDDWINIKPKFEYYEERFDWNKVETARNKQKKGVLSIANIPGGFDLPRILMGEEGVCFCYYDQPELMKDILETVAETAFRVLDRVSDKLVIDVLHIHEDMAGKSGPLIGPDLVIKYIKPYYRKIWDMLSSKGTRIFSQDSDGNIISVIDALLECGVTQMYPMEPAAGMDVVELRKKYGKRLALKGGIDKHVLRMNKQDIRDELEYKMQPLMKAGGMVFALDHRIPNGTPLENYKYYVELGREILGLPQDIKNKGWARMAF
ncbi:MAG: Uroporphyrinogen decarboxylase [candidate division WS2 bacterium]|uniref:Uroporphyrinogen decarboxylase n=1 Tax=Psychracetigena formicireducens TaxID=2986056 RepID=A0A9E2F7R3_PSYF1|nr:Uroporphyrinogen decarboxylase [Candidatus Psychracetigena formicireducens]